MVTYQDSRFTTINVLPSDYTNWFCQEYNVKTILTDWDFLTLRGVYSAVAYDNTVIGPCDSLKTLAAMCRIVTS